MAFGYACRSINGDPSINVNPSISIRAVVFFTFWFSLFSVPARTQSHSVARQWNDALLSAIKTDFARPTVHARNLFHAAVAMYDSWAVFEEGASTYLLNHSFRSYYCPFNGIAIPENKIAAQEEAMSYALYRLLTHRFKNSPGARQSLLRFRTLLHDLGYDSTFSSTDYSGGAPAALGNYLGEQLVEYGLRDGANEINIYRNKFYEPYNRPINPFQTGNPFIKDPNRWQPLTLTTFIDQSGIQTKDGVPPFLSAEWGKVVPFALRQDDLKIRYKDGDEYWVYHDPGNPPFLGATGQSMADEFKWTFSLVAIWASHLDPDDGVMIDISPASQGNITDFPATFEEIKAFYDLMGGGDAGAGYTINPKTNASYTPQVVPRGDYTRVLAEFWADGPDSETPPGHWFTILNYVNDHPQFEKRMGGQGKLIPDLEWDVKSYFILGGAVHDAAIAAWGIKGYYDYVRPISAIRFMAQHGQSTDRSLPNYDPEGIPLVDGYVELVKSGDPLAGPGGQHIHKVKLYTWRGPGYIEDPEHDKAGVGWILAENWWPYQRPTFVTPPFAGYVSGHSTFSRAAAEALTRLTGDEYFPGGMCEFPVKKNEYLVFEEGPSVDLVLQWAKYKDASDQCSLSRIWGGIHPPADDIPGRLIGQRIGEQAFYFAKTYFDGEVIPEPEPERFIQFDVYPNPLTASDKLRIKTEPLVKSGNVQVYDVLGRLILDATVRNNYDNVMEFDLSPYKRGMYLVKMKSEAFTLTRRFTIQ